MNLITAKVVTTAQQSHWNPNTNHDKPQVERCHRPMKRLKSNRMQSFSLLNFPNVKVETPNLLIGQTNATLNSNSNGYIHVMLPHGIRFFPNLIITKIETIKTYIVSQTFDYRRRAVIL